MEGLSTLSLKREENMNEADSFRKEIGQNWVDNGEANSIDDGWRRFLRQN